MLNEWWSTWDIPDEMKTAKVASTYKKENPELQENYRPISLLNTFYKTIVQAVKWRLAEALDKKIMKSQYGFRAEKSTVDATFLARRFQELSQRKGE
jgi:hypothetical protein